MALYFNKTYFLLFLYILHLNFCTILAFLKAGHLGRMERKIRNEREILNGKREGK
jgi:hypothetical protein